MSDYKDEAAALQQELIEYFNYAQSNKSMNVLPASLIVEKWGSVAVTGGLAWIVRDINLLSEKTLRLALSTPGDKLTNMVVARLMTNMGYMHDLIEECGDNAHQWLMDSLRQFHEDVRALAAYFLADNAFVSPKSKGRLERAYSYTEGTSCQMALALALYMTGEGKYLRAFIEQGYFGSKERYQSLLQIARDTNPMKNEEDWETGAVRIMVVPEVLGASPDEAVLLKIIAIDIESDGKFARSTHPNWKRKKYDR